MLLRIAIVIFFPISEPNEETKVRIQPGIPWQNSDPTFYWGQWHLEHVLPANWTDNVTADSDLPLQKQPWVSMSHKPAADGSPSGKLATQPSCRNSYWESPGEKVQCKNIISLMLVPCLDFTEEVVTQIYELEGEKKRGQKNMSGFQVPSIGISGNFGVFCFCFLSSQSSLHIPGARM